MAIYIEIEGYPETRMEIEFPRVRKKQVKKAVVLFIGGAGDKQDYYIAPASKVIAKLSRNFLLATSHLKHLDIIYLGYNEVKGSTDIQDNIIAKISNREHTAIFIVGHSLGGWNGAHLSKILTDKGYHVDTLITLDPVGMGNGVQVLSDIHWFQPKPKADYWIQITTDPEDYALDDLVADLGGQWRPNYGMDINYRCKCSHVEAQTMFRRKVIKGNFTAEDILLDRIHYFLTH